MNSFHAEYKNYETKPPSCSILPDQDENEAWEVRTMQLTDVARKVPRATNALSVTPQPLNPSFEAPW